MKPYSSEYNIREYIVNITYKEPFTNRSSSVYKLHMFNMINPEIIDKMIIQFFLDYQSSSIKPTEIA